MSEHIEIPLPEIALSGFDTGFSEEEQNIQEGLHRFAIEVMRPIGQELDRMSPDEAYQPGSPFWQFHEEVKKLGLGPEAMAGLSKEQMTRMEGIVIQELAWGDAGLTVSSGVSGQAQEMARAAGNQEMVELCEGKLGCWIATQPDRGSDGLNLYKEERYPGSTANKGNLQATFKGDEIIINGQSSAWVSNGIVAEVGLIDAPADYGNGFYDKDGNTHGCNLIVPLDLPGISRGKPLHKIGKRPLPQGEIYFDNVKVPRRFAVANQENYELVHAQSWAHAGTAMSHIAVGVARAAMEMALAYTHERVQGGNKLSNLQLTQFRMGGIGMKVEAMKAMARHVALYTRTSDRPHPYYTAAGKAFCCNELITVVRESLNLMGGVGLTHEYPIEKLYRDAQSMQIEDGEVNLLQMHFGHLLGLIHEHQGFGKN
jgi:alkylation response protein AidB-like acyl-CoA dehydrogenase